MHKSRFGVGVLLLAVMLMPLASPVHAHQVTGAIFTTLADGSEVNFNIYPDKEAVYLDGGPGPGAPQEAAGLPDGDYVFMVTDPSGKVLLSTDFAGCRRFTVSGGIITSVAVAGGCAHLTGVDVDHGAITVQLMPYLDTPNNGGEYKVWVTPVAEYLCGFFEVECSLGKHGFVNDESKTDNFKVKVTPVVEIDTRFWRDGSYIDGAGVTWIDTHGASNKKWAYYRPDLYVFHEAHVEAPEQGLHKIVIASQALCLNIGEVYVDGRYVGYGAQTVNVRISPKGGKGFTVFVDVSCYD